MRAADGGAVRVLSSTAVAAGQAGRRLPVSGSLVRTWARDVHDGDVWDGAQWRRMDRRMATEGEWVESCKAWDVEHDRVPEHWQDGVHFTFEAKASFKEGEICAVVDRQSRHLVFARIIQDEPEGKKQVCDIALDNTNDSYRLDVPKKDVAKLNAERCGRGVPFWVNPELDLMTWQKPPDAREFAYADGKALFDKQHWSEACRKFEEVLDLGGGEDFHHARKYVTVCVRHLEHRKHRQDAMQVYDDAKRLFDRGLYAEAQTAFRFVVEIARLGDAGNFHHTREYLAKCRHMLQKKARDAGDDTERAAPATAPGCHRGGRAAVLSAGQHAIAAQTSAGFPDKQALTHYHTRQHPAGVKARAHKQAVSRQQDTTSPPHTATPRPVTAGELPFFAPHRQTDGDCTVS